MKLTNIKPLNRKCRTIRKISSISCSCLSRYYNILSTKIIRCNHQINQPNLNKRLLKQRNLNKLISPHLISPTVTLIISTNTTSLPISIAPPPHPKP
ncbi:hypothetical protein HanXRQr2_Chr17g0798381 [Helianthus annuus]|uniref:Uncharacterized protein n=1 Tax=Helianthus annuus TaxID=4232 RepID=A0A9K3DGB6_HELAN|nr:hypothetical protein HanXRQr2_Chr17g0798381 [Helianthus annuus]